MSAARLRMASFLNELTIPLNEHIKQNQYLYCLEREASTVISFKTQAATVIDWHTNTHPPPNWNLLGGRQSEAALFVTDRMPRGLGKLNSHREGFN